jgi:7-carboxy-7-deazaguanine synthase
MDISAVDPRVSRIVDIKTPGSGEAERNRWENLALLTAHDAVKLVITDRTDYEWARDVLNRYQALLCAIFFSPSHDELSAKELGTWIVEDRLPVRLQIQLHKLLWGDERGR